LTATGSGNELTVVRQALWGLPMQRFEHEHSQLELNSLANWKPASAAAGEQAICGRAVERR